VAGDEDHLQTKFEGVVDAAAAVVPSLLRIRARRTRKRHTLCDRVVDIVCRDDTLGGMALLNPLNQRGEHVEDICAGAHRYGGSSLGRRPGQFSLLQTWLLQTMTRGLADRDNWCTARKAALL
jgi:hypothetical protein